MPTAMKPSKEDIAAKAPPHNLEAERAVIGAILIDNEALHKVMDIVRPDDFYRDAHKKIYQAILLLSDKNEPTDFLTVSDHLKSGGHLDLIGGASYLASLADSMPTSANIVSYARIVREKSVLRHLISISTEIATRSYEGGEDSDSLIDTAEKKIFEISEQRLKSAFTVVKDVVKDSFKQIEKLFENQKDVTGLATGFKEIDRMTSGLQPSDLVVLAARPSMGKTALALNIAEHAALHEKASVAIFSLEMSKESLVTRMLCSQAHVDSMKLRQGRFEQPDWARLTKAAGSLSEARIFIDDSGSISIMEVRAKARRLKKEQGLDLAIIDYIQLVTPTYSKATNREQEISEISRSLKSLAKELKVPVLALSQLNRAVESRQNRRPMLSDLRDSGAIEQDADVIAFIYRDELYDPNTPDKGIAEVIIGKQRNGPTGVCRCAFLSSHTRFENLAVDQMETFVPPMAEPMEAF